MNQTADYDLLLTGGRVIDAANDLDEVCDVAFKDGRIAEVGKNLSPDGAKESRDAAGLIVAPGLVDLHTHVYWGGTAIGIDPTDYARASGTTTMVDAGTAGAGNFAGFRAHIIEAIEPRIFAYLNVSFPGIFAFSKEVMFGESRITELLDPRVCLRVAEENADLIVGIKVRIGMRASGPNAVFPLDTAIEVAEAAGLPVMCHLDWPPPSRRDVLERLRPGDILTHCFRGFPGAPVDREGSVREEILAAREKGIIFDIGHGSGSFGFATAEKMLENGFLPDAISSDVHCLSIEGPAFDQLTTLSKFLHLGMSLKDVIAATTWGPAKAIGKTELGNFSPGSVGDATLLRLVDGPANFIDSDGETRTGDKRLALAGVVLNGAWWQDGDSA